jgi:hypothetical protein
LMKIPMLLRPARAAQRSEAREVCRITPSARVGNRFSAPQIVWNKSNRCAGERGGARVGRPRWARILTITGGSSMAAMIFKLPMGPALAVAVRLSQFVFSFRHR